MYVYRGRTTYTHVTFNNTCGSLKSTQTNIVKTAPTWQKKKSYNCILFGSLNVLLTASRRHHNTRWETLNKRYTRKFQQRSSMTQTIMFYLFGSSFGTLSY